MSGKKFCRLCMNEVYVASRNHYSGDIQTKEILLNIFPGMNVELTSTIKLCEECYATINFIIGVKKTLLSRNHEFVNQIIVPYCALCSRVETSSNKFLRKDYPNRNVLNEMIHIALSEWKYINADANICVICWSWIKKIYSFKRQCFKIEERLKLYCDERKLRLLNDNDLFVFIEEIFCNRSGQASQNKEIKPDVTETDSSIIYHQQYFKITGEVYSNLDKYYDDDDLKDNISIEEHSLCDEKNDVIHTQPEVINLDNNYPNVSNIKTEDTFYENTNSYGDTDYQLKIEIQTSNNDTVINLVDDNDTDDNDCYIYEDNVSTSIQHTNLDKNNNWDQETVSCISTEEDESFQTQKARSHVVYVDTAQYTELYDKFVTNFLDSNRYNNKDATPNVLPQESEQITQQQADVVESSGNNLDESEDANISQDVEEEGLLLLDDDCFEVVQEGNNSIDLTNVDSYISETKRQKRNTHQSLNHGEFWGCYVCVAAFSDKAVIRKHLLNHEEPWNKYGRFQCRFCPYRANWKGSVTRHEDFHSEKNERILAAKKLKYICPYCSVTYSKRGDVQSHMNEHIISWKQFQCVDCMFTTNTSETLRSHYTMYHSLKKDPSFHSTAQTDLFIPTHYD